MSTVKRRIECPTCEGCGCDASGNPECEDGLVEVSFPSKFEVCGTCRGKGKHVDPAIDGNGITAEEWDRGWDQDERESYLAGDYDVTCQECGGLRVVEVVDEARLTEAHRGQLAAAERLLYIRAQDDDSERRLRRMEGGW